MRKLKRGKKKKICITLLIIIIVTTFVILFSKAKIKNIYIYDNNIVKDQEIIDQAGLTNYPSFLKNTSYRIKKNLKKNKYIKDVKIKKDLLLQIHIYITEYKPLFIDDIKQGNGFIVDNNFEVRLLPFLVLLFFLILTY